MLSLVVVVVVAPFIRDTVIFDGEGLADVLLAGALFFDLVGVLVGDEDLFFIALFSIELEVDGSEVVVVIKIGDNFCMLELDLPCIFTAFEGENPLVFVGEGGFEEDEDDGEEILTLCTPFIPLL